MKLIIFLFIPFFNFAQANDIIYCDRPEIDAHPFDGNKSILEIVIENYTKQDSFELDYSAKFYINATILKDGSVFEFYVEEILKDGETNTTKINTKNFEKWMPAITNGNPCNQKLRIKIYLHFR